MTAPDPDKLNEPVLFEGKPIFPSAWSSEEREEYLALVEELDVETAALEEAKGIAPTPSPAAKALAAKRAEVEAAREARLEAESARAEEEDFAALEVTYGKGRVGRLRTVSGTFFMRPLSEAEVDKSEARAAALTKADERISVGKQMTLDTIVHPRLPQKEQRAKAASHLAAYPADWTAFFRERDRLISGVKEDAGKGG